MHRRTLRTTIVAGAAGIAAAIGLAAPSFASTSAPAAATTPASVKADVTTVIGHITFHGMNTTTSPGDATGYFHVDGDMLPLTAPGLTPANKASHYTLAGPITCLDVQGDKAGFLYPVTKSSGPGVVFQGKTLYITVQGTTGSEPASVGFAGPIPNGALKSCPPLVPFMVAQSGSATVTPAH